MNTTVVIAGIVCTGTVSLPDPLPTPQRIARIKTYQMRTGQGGAGFRVFRRMGFHVSQQDLVIERLSVLSAAQIAILESLRVTQAEFNVSLASTTYRCIFQEKGLDAQPHSRYGYDEYYQADVRCHVLSQ